MSRQTLSQIADRIERAADRLRFSGRESDAEVCAQAASRIRQGTPLEAAKAIEKELMTGMLAAVQTRLIALSGSGEYDIDTSTPASSDPSGGFDVSVSDDTPHVPVQPDSQPSVDLTVTSLDDTSAIPPSPPDTSSQPQQQDTGTDFSVDSGNEPSAANVPPDTSTETGPSTPILRAPDGTERPWPGEPEPDAPEHSPEDERTKRMSEGPSQEEETPEVGE